MQSIPSIFLTTCTVLYGLPNITSSTSEAINNKVKRWKRVAYEYKDIRYFRLKVHQHCELLYPKIST
ncbi:MAG: transposase [Desulfobacterales bacterium]|nr:transposase [Desulfobacterales bacterium]